MQLETRVHLEELCKQAAVEQDSAKLLELVKQIIDLSKNTHRSDVREPLTGKSKSALSPTSSTNTRILLADDNRILRRTIRTLLVEENPTWEICEAENGRETLEKVLALQPALVMLDLNLPDMSGCDVAQQIRQLSHATKIIICSFSDSAHLAATAQHLGADGYFEKTSSPDDLHETITMVLNSQRNKVASLSQQ